MENLRGSLLISSGALYDPNFRHTVVLIGEHNEDGAVGIVLNRALSVMVETAVPSLAHLVPAGSTLFEGGPVEQEKPVLLAEFTEPDSADVPVFGSVGFLLTGISPDTERKTSRTRVFAGYSGWGPGQLEAELAMQSWILEPARADDVFTDEPDLLWSRVLERKGPEYRTLSRMPFDPSMN